MNQTKDFQSSTMELTLVEGDLSRLTARERLQYYNMVCESLGLNPLTRPFEYLRLSGRLTLYARRNCTDQLRNLHNVSVIITAREFAGGLYIVTARATTPSGRTDEAIGAAPIEGLKGEALANALMKAETKAKRRVTLSICGLGWLDETEVRDIPDAQPYYVDPDAQIASETALQRDENGNNGHLITDLQRRRLYAMVKEIGLSRDEAIQLIRDRYQVDTSAQLTKKQASDFLNYLAGLSKSLNA